MNSLLKQTSFQSAVRSQSGSNLDCFWKAIGLMATSQMQELIQFFITTSNGVSFTDCKSPHSGAQSSILLPSRGTQGNSKLYSFNTVIAKCTASVSVFIPICNDLG